MPCCSASGPTGQPGSSSPNRYGSRHGYPAAVCPARDTRQTVRLPALLTYGAPR